MCLTAGLPLAGVIATVQFFRDALVETVVDTPAAVKKTRTDTVQIVRRINRMLLGRRAAAARPLRRGVSAGSDGSSARMNVKQSRCHLF